MVERPKGGPQESLAAVAVVGQLGLAVAAPIVVGVAAGVYLEHRWGGGVGAAALVGGIVLGIGGAGVAGYRVSAPFLKSK